ncbi:MAG: pilus assembly protein TadG-related protein [Bryobacteraceae bacterium]
MRRSAINLGRQDGQAVILVVVAMSILLIGALGLAIDGGQMYAHRQMAQAAADAAAQAGMMSIFDGTNATSAYPFGTGTPPIASSTCTTADGRTPCVYARNNGFGGTTADTVTLSFPATVSGVALSSASVPALAVTVQRTLKTGLIRFIGGPATVTITAKGTAALVGTVSPTCVYALDPSAQNAFQATNGATVALNGCGIAVDSTNSDAATVSGASTVTASAISIVGGDVISGGGSTTPAPVTGAPSVADPLASLPAPVVGACNYTNYSPGWGNWTLNPGTYCGGINISNGATATFNAGTYIIKGGGVTLVGGTTDTGSGVMFYLTGTNASYGSVTISNGANATFSGPTSGSCTGIVFYQDRTITSSANATFSGGVSMKVTGTLYFPTTSVLFSNGSSVSNVYTAIVAKQVSFTGGTSLQYDATGLKTGLFSKGVALVQ